MNISIGINVPQDVNGVADVERLRRFVESAEREGYDSLWVSESVKPNVLDPLAVLNFMASATRNVRLGAAVLLPAYRAPLQLARELASFDQLSGGRSIFGVGLGNDREQYARLGLDPGHRGKHFEAGIRLLRDLMSNDRVTERNQWWELDQVPRPLPPVQRPTPPIWFGARHPMALERAVRLGDGWIGAGSMTRASFVDALDQIRDLLGRAGRNSANFTVAKRVYLHVADDHSRVEMIRDWFGHRYGRAQLAEDVVVLGDADACVEHLNGLAAMGVTTLILHPMVDMHRQMQAIARDVIPRVSGAFRGHNLDR